MHALLLRASYFLQASKFVASFALSMCKRNSIETESGSEDLFAYVESCIQCYLKVTRVTVDPLPKISSLARVLVLAVDQECTTGCKYVI